MRLTLHDPSRWPDAVDVHVRLARGVLRAPRVFVRAHPRAEVAVTTATSVAGGTTVAIVATNLPASASPACRFGDVVVPATRAEAMFLGLDAAFAAYNATATDLSRFTRSELEEISRARPSSPTILLCVAPPGGAGFTTADVGLETLEGGSFDLPSRRAAVEFEYETTARVFSASPSTATSAGGTLVRLTGAHFTPSGRSCGFGDASPSAAVFVSSALVACESPAREEGSEFVELALDHEAETWTRDAATVTAVDHAALHAIRPAQAVDIGGVVFAASGSSFLADAFDACAFGATGPARGRLSGDGVVECVSPRRTPDGNLSPSGHEVRRGIARRTRRARAFSPRRRWRRRSPRGASSPGVRAWSSSVRDWRRFDTSTASTPRAPSASVPSP